MADQKEQKSSPNPTMANGHRHIDAEADRPAHDARQQRKTKRTKCLIYLVLFVIFQTGVITLFMLTIMKVRTPKFRVRSATFNTFNLGTSANPSFDLNTNVEFSLKNANFGRYKYKNTTVVFYYRGAEVGQGYIRESRVGWRSNKKFRVTVDLRLANNPQLANDFSAGVLPITSQAMMRGKVELLFVLKKNKGTEMECSMEIVTATRQLRNIVCK